MSSLRHEWVETKPEKQELTLDFNDPITLLWHCGLRSLLPVRGIGSAASMWSE